MKYIIIIPRILQKLSDIENIVNTEILDKYKSIDKSNYIKNCMNYTNVHFNNSNIYIDRLNAYYGDIYEINPSAVDNDNYMLCSYCSSDININYSYYVSFYSHGDISEICKNITSKITSYLKIYNPVILITDSDNDRYVYKYLNEKENNCYTVRDINSLFNTRMDVLLDELDKHQISVYASDILKELTHKRNSIETFEHKKMDNNDHIIKVMRSNAMDGIMDLNKKINYLKNIIDKKLRNNYYNKYYMMDR